MPHRVASAVAVAKITLARIPRSRRPAMVGAVVAIVWVLLIAALPSGTQGKGLDAVGSRLATSGDRLAKERLAVLRVYLDPAGSDSNDGATPNRAVRSLTAAQRVIGAARPTTDVEVRIKQGTYVASPTEWTTYVPGRTITFLPIDYEFGEGIEEISGRPIFRGDGRSGFWLRAVQQPGGRQGDTRLGFYFLQVENYSAGGIAFDGGTEVDSKRMKAPASAGTNANTVYGMVFRDLGSRHVRSGFGFGAIDLINSGNNIIQNNTFERLENIGNPSEVTLIHGVYLSHHSSNNVISGNSFYRISGDPVRTRDDSNENKVFNNTFKKSGSNAYFSDWFSAGEHAKQGSGLVECASRANVFYNNRLISGYRGRIEVWWTSPLEADYTSRGCRNDGQDRVRAWNNQGP